MQRSTITATSTYRAGAVALIVALGTIIAAHGFERFGGYQPCPLCLTQRWAYYAALPGLFVALVLYAAGRGTAAGLVFFAVALGFLANAGLGTYHAGAEWQLWPGPDACAAAGGGVAPSAGGLLESLQAKSPVIRCDRAPWVFLGLSFAGWNVLISLFIFGSSLMAAFDAVRGR